MTVRLLPLARAHAGAMLAWMQRDDVRDNVGVAAEPTMERTLAFIERALDDDAMAAFAIHDDEEHVGNVVLDRIDRRVGTSRFSIYLGAPERRGRGVGRAATRLALAHAFDALELQKVWLTVHVQNTRAITAYAGEGFRVEGVLRREFLLRGELVDVLYMGVLRGEERR